MIQFKTCHYLDFSCIEFYSQFYIVHKFLFLESGSYYNEYHYSMYHIAREIVYENYYNGPLFALLDEGDIYNFNVLYCNGPCESFQPTASHFYCLRDGHVYQSTKSQLSCSWNLVLSEVMCDSFDANDLFIICWVKGAGLYKKRIPSESGKYFVLIISDLFFYFLKTKIL